MIKLSLFDAAGHANGIIHVNAQHVVSLQPANPRGTIITSLRGAIHVNQTVDQILEMMPNGRT